MIENDAHGLLQNLITAPMIDGLPLAEEKKKGSEIEPSKSRKTFRVYNEHFNMIQKVF